MKILVVDDHSLITDALSVLFLDLDPQAEVITTRTAESALQLQQQNLDLDLVVLDLGLPGVSGTSLLEAMVAQAPEMKILVLSGQQDQRNVMRVLQLGAAGFVPKSMASETLLSAVKFVLSGGVYIPADLLEEVQPLRHVRRTGSPTRGGHEPHRTHGTAGTGTAAAGAGRANQDHLPRTGAVRRHREDPRDGDLPRLQCVEPH